MIAYFFCRITLNQLIFTYYVVYHIAIRLNKLDLASRANDLLYWCQTARTELDEEWRDWQ